jgi:hypothetical protein
MTLFDVAAAFVKYCAAVFAANAYAETNGAIAQALRRAVRANQPQIAEMRDCDLWNFCHMPVMGLAGFRSAGIANDL